MLYIVRAPQSFLYFGIFHSFMLSSTSYLHWPNNSWPIKNWRSKRSRKIGPSAPLRPFQRCSVSETNTDSIARANIWRVILNSLLSLISLHHILLVPVSNIPQICPSSSVLLSPGAHPPLLCHMNFRNRLPDVLLAPSCDSLNSLFV